MANEGDEYGGDGAGYEQAFKTTQQKPHWSGNLAWLSKTGQVNVSFRQYSARQIEGLQQKAANGNAFAAYKLGLVYEFGQDSLNIRPDSQLAFRYYYQATQTPGQEMARFRLGKCYAAGFGVQRNLRMALEYFMPLAQSGSERAQFQAGVCFDELGQFGDAFRCYDMAAQQHNWAALHKSGVALLEGRGVAQDLHEAFRRLNEAASNGYYLSNEAMGRYYYDRQDFETAISQLRRAVESCRFSDSGVAAYLLSECYTWGFGTPRDPDLAQTYIMCASKWRFSDSRIKGDFQQRQAVIAQNGGQLPASQTPSPNAGGFAVHRNSPNHLGMRPAPGATQQQGSASATPSPSPSSSASPSSFQPSMLQAPRFYPKDAPQAHPHYYVGSHSPTSPPPMSPLSPHSSRKHQAHNRYSMPVFVPSSPLPGDFGGFEARRQTMPAVAMTNAMSAAAAARTYSRSQPQPHASGPSRGSNEELRASSSSAAAAAVDDYDPEDDSLLDQAMNQSLSMMDQMDERRRPLSTGSIEQIVLASPTAAAVDQQMVLHLGSMRLAQAAPPMPAPTTRFMKSPGSSNRGSGIWENVVVDVPSAGSAWPQS